MKAIDTIYKGYKFRSRLEARWAVYFDGQGIRWEYEKEGYEFDGIRYLPDFWLPQVSMWAEVKPEVSPDDYIDQLKKLHTFVKHIKQPCLLLYGMPDAKTYVSVQPSLHGAGIEGIEGVDYCVTNYHNYHIYEHRFYCEPGIGDTIAFDDIVEDSIAAAKQARFEYGENGQ